MINIYDYFYNQQKPENDLIIVDKDDDFTFQEKKQEKNKKRIHIENAIIRPFHYRYDQNSVEYNEESDRFSTYSEQTHKQNIENYGETDNEEFRFKLTDEQFATLHRPSY